MPAKVSDKARASVTAGLANRREPVGGGDVEADGIGDRARRRSEAAEDRQQQTEGGDRLRQELAGAAAQRRRQLPERQLEHQMRDPDAEHGAGDLRRRVDAGRRPFDAAAQGEGERHRRIEMRAGQRAEHEDEHAQHGAGRQGVAQQGERAVTAGEALRHDAGADHRGEQECRAQKLRDRPLRRRARHVGSAIRAAPTRPISRSLACNDSRSRPATGSATKISMRLSSMR